MKIACFSVAAMDYFPQVDEYHAGGNALNQAINLAELGHDTAFFGAVGNDTAGDHILELLRNSGVDCRHCIQQEGETASNQLLNDEHGERNEIKGAWKNGVFGTYRFDSSTWQTLQTYDLWSTNSFDPHFETTLELHSQARATSSPRKLCVDFLHLPDAEVIKKSIHLIDIAYVGGTADMEPMLATLAQAHPNTVLVLTLGAGGSVAFYQNRRWVQPALPVEKVIDTTGCGDAFQAAFTASYFENGDIEAALLAGAKQGRKTTQHQGALQG